MARTPLFARFARMAARRSRTAVDEDRRRWLLGMSGAALALPFASGCGADVAEAQLAIVGGGIAGLHAAYRLKQRGLVATIYEASKRLGGRMYTDRESFAAQDGQHCELGGELIDTPHATMRDLADELEIPLLDYATDDQSLRGDTVFLDGRIVPEDELVAGFQPIAAAIDAAFSTATDPEALPSYLDDNGMAALDQLSITGWLDSIGAAGPTRELLEIAYTIEYGLPANEQSALNLLSLIGTETDKLALFGESDERFHSALGSDAFTTRLAAKLDPTQVVLRHRLTRIELRGDGRYLLDFDTGEEKRGVLADRVLLTLPFTMLRQVELAGFSWPEPKGRAIAELGYGTNTKLMVGFAARIWRVHGSNGGTYSDTGYQASWDTSRLQAGTAGILTNFTGGQRGLEVGQGTAKKQRDDFVKEIDSVFPGMAQASNGAVARFSWPTQPYTLGSYSAYRVGQWTTISGAERERVGNLFFAGEHTSVDAQGFMEGAALTGAMAAEEIATELGLPAPMSSTVASARIASRARLALREGSWIRPLARNSRRAAPMKAAKGS